MRTLTITAAEWASVQDGTLWLVREGLWDAPPDTDVLAGQSPFRPIPPVEFVQAPCEWCHGTRVVLVERDNGGIPAPCPDCRIGLEITDGFAFPVVVGHAYPVGRPLPIIAYQNGEYWLGIDGAIRVPAVALGGASRAADDDDKLDKWAQQLRVVQS